MNLVNEDTKDERLLHEKPFRTAQNEEAAGPRESMADSLI